MTTKAGQAPPIGSSHLGISGGTCHSFGSASCSEGLHGVLLGAGLGLGWERRKGEVTLLTFNVTCSSGERQGTGIIFCCGHILGFFFSHLK